MPAQVAVFEGLNITGGDFGIFVDQNASLTLKNCHVSPRSAALSTARIQPNSSLASACSNLAPPS
jgi:hypothetical protein